MVQIVSQILHLFDGLKTLCKQYNLRHTPHRISVEQLSNAICNQNGQPHGGSDLIGDTIGQYIDLCEQLRLKIFEYQELQTEYKKLEEVLQKNETEIRRHIGVEQELKLYIDTIKNLYDESESRRAELLRSSKKIIRELKADKEQLYARLRKYEDSAKVWSAKKEADGRLDGCDKSCPRHRNQRKVKENVKTDYDAKYERSEDRLDSQFIKVQHNSAIKNLKGSNRKVQRLNPAKNTISFKAELTDRGLLYAHKKKLIDMRKKQNQQLIPHNSSVKRKQYHEQTSVKKANDKTVFTGNNQEVGKAMALKNNSRSQKKAHQSLFSLQSFYLDKEAQDSDNSSIERAQKPNSFYLSPDLLNKAQEEQL